MFYFFPESLSDFSEYRELLAASKHVKTIQADINEAKDSDVFFYTNARSEIAEAALYIIALHENQNVPWDAVSVSIPDTGNYGPYVFREFDNRNIPYVRQSGKPLASYPAGQFFAAIAGCSSENFSFASLTALVLNQHLPWKENERIQALIKFGIDNNCICSWTEKEEEKINVWEDAFENHANEFAWL
jgi:ATP-dependent helicase/DNAse subunit B